MNAMENEAVDFQYLLRVTQPPLTAMLLISANACGLNYYELGNLRLSSIDLNAGWMTTRQWRVPLWPGTLAAIQESIDQRPDPRDDAEADLLFLRRRPRRSQSQKWVTETELGDFDSIKRALQPALRQVYPGRRDRQNWQTWSVGSSVRALALAADDWAAGYRFAGYDEITSRFRGRRTLQTVPEVSDRRLMAVAEVCYEWLLSPRRAAVRRQLEAETRERAHEAERRRKAEARRTWNTTPKTLITGNTYPVRERLKELGGRWDPEQRGWLVPTEKAEQALALVAGAETRLEQTRPRSR